MARGRYSGAAKRYPVLSFNPSPVNSLPPVSSQTLCMFLFVCLHINIISERFYFPTVRINAFLLQSFVILCIMSLTSDCRNVMYFILTDRRRGWGLVTRDELNSTLTTCVTPDIIRTLHHNIILLT